MAAFSPLPTPGNSASHNYLTRFNKTAIQGKWPNCKWKRKPSAYLLELLSTWIFQIVKRRNLHFKGAWHHTQNGRNEIPKYISVGISSLIINIFGDIKC